MTNQFIAIVTKNNQKKQSFNCNSIASSDSGTNIYGVIEESSHEFDILIAFIPKDKQVELKILK